jgi:hypothetical protein
MDDIGMIDVEKWIDRFKNTLSLQIDIQQDYMLMRFDNRDLKEIVYLLGELKAFQENQAENESYHSGGNKNV